MRAKIFIRSIAIYLLTSVISGCATIDTSSVVPVVPVEALINRLKCGFARALVADSRRRSGLFGGTANVELDVNVIQGVDASGKISVGIPIFAGAGTVTPSLGFGHTETRTINSSIDFDINLRSHGSEVCRHSHAESEADAGFSLWIGSVISGVDLAVAGPPTARMKKYVYESDFTIKSSNSFGVELEIVPVKLSTSIGSSRSDIQHLKITIDAVRVVGGKVVRDGGPSFAPFGFGRQAPLNESFRRGDFNRTPK